MVFFW